MPDNRDICLSLLLRLQKIIFRLRYYLAGRYWVYLSLCIFIDAFCEPCLLDYDSADYTISRLDLFIYLCIGYRLRYTQPDRVRPFRVPGGNIGMWIIAGFGFLTAMLVFLLGFVPPEKLDYASVWHYEAYLSAGVIIIVIACDLFNDYTAQISFVT